MTLKCEKDNFCYNINTSICEASPELRKKRNNLSNNNSFCYYKFIPSKNNYCISKIEKEQDIENGRNIIHYYVELNLVYLIRE